MKNKTKTASRFLSFLVSGMKLYGNDIENLLNSIPVLEQHLMKGGFILDSNNEPCKDGDTVILHDDGKDTITKLEFSVKNRAFFVTIEEGVKVFLSDMDFTKYE